MKTNDIINEGPVWDAIKGVAKNIGVGPRSTIAGAKQSYYQGQNQAELNTQTKNMLPYWQKHAQSLQASGVNMRDLGKYEKEMQDWMSTSGFPGNKDFSKMNPLGSTEPLDVQKYLAQAVALNSSGKLQSKTPPDQQSQNQQPQGQQAPAVPPAAPVAQAQPTAAPKFTSPQQVVDSMVKTLPPDWIPTITAELLKRQKVGATPK